MNAFVYIFCIFIKYENISKFEGPISTQTTNNTMAENAEAYGTDGRGVK